MGKIGVSLRKTLGCREMLKIGVMESLDLLHLRIDEATTGHNPSGHS